MNNRPTKKRGVIYAKVNKNTSTHDTFHTIQHQISQCREKMKSDNVEEVHPPITDVTSGKNSQRTGLEEVLKLAESKSIDYLYISEIDRIGRDSQQLLDFILKLRSHDVTIVTPFETLDIKKLSDLIHIAVRAYSAENQTEIRRNTVITSRRQAFINREWNSAIPLAYEKKEKWITKSPGWDPVIDALFNLFLEHKNCGIVCKTMNDHFRGFLKKPLTRHQVKQILRNPLYMGRPKLFGAITEKKFPETVVDDPNLRYVTEDLFAKAQEIIALTMLNNCS